MDFDIAKEKAVRYLATTLRTEYEVREKLKRLNYDKDLIDKVINYLLDIKYIDDESYVDSYLIQSNRMLQYSCYEISMKLRQKGIKKEILETRISNLKKTDYENNVIDKLKRGKLKTMEVIKQKAYLYRKGFRIDSEMDY